MTAKIQMINLQQLLSMKMSLDKVMNLTINYQKTKKLVFQQMIMKIFNIF